MASGELKELLPTMHEPRLVSAMQGLLLPPFSNSCFRPSSAKLQNTVPRGRNVNRTINKRACKDCKYLCMTELIHEQPIKTIWKKKGWFHRYISQVTFVLSVLNETSQVYTCCVAERSRNSTL